MRILFLTQIVPYPPDAGPRVKTLHVLRYLAAQGHEIHLITFCRAEEQKNLDGLRGLCQSITPVPIRRSRVADGLALARSLLRRSSFLMERDNLPAFHRAVGAALQNMDFDVLHADQLTMAQFLFPWAGKGKRVFDAHNATWKIFVRSLSGYPAIVRPFLANETKYLRQTERKIVEDFDYTLTVTDIDKQFLLELVEGHRRDRVGQKIITAPITIDCDGIQPVDYRPGSKEILTLGTLVYPPNQDGIRWFLNEVFPHILLQEPEVHLNVVGKSPPADFLEMAKTQPSRITVPGYVPDLRPYYEKAGCIVVPVRSGSGMRVRILEAFAQGIPVVTTTVGLEGIEAVPGEDVLVEDDPAAFAAAVVRCLRDGDLAAQLARNGRKTALHRYHWRNALRPMDVIYQRSLTGKTVDS